MIVAANQPYLFPYLGYFQLIAAADVFVHSDSLQYEYHSWINRNRVLVQGRPHLITSPLIHGTEKASINNRRYEKDFLKLWVKAVEYNYARAPFKLKVLSLFDKWIESGELNLAAFNIMTLEDICNYIGIHTKLLRLSSLNIDMSADKVNKTIAIAKYFEATDYINLPGGRVLYDVEEFAHKGIRLRFINPSLPPYRQQRTRVFFPGLSIIDILCNQSPSEIFEMVNSEVLS